MLVGWYTSTSPSDSKEYTLFALIMVHSLILLWNEDNTPKGILLRFLALAHGLIQHVFVQQQQNQLLKK